MAKSKKNSDIASMDDKELMDAWTQLGADVEEGKARLREFSQEHQRRERKAQLTRSMNYSAEDLELLQEIAAEGVESGEAVGVIGNG